MLEPSLVTLFRHTDSTNTTPYISNSQITAASGLRWDKLPPLEQEPSMPARLLFIGAHRVGTSSLIRRYNLGLFNHDYTPEIAKVMRHTKSIQHPRRGFFTTVQFWDVEGSDSRVALQCAQKAHAVAVIFDVTNRSSFEKAQKLLDGVNPRALSLLVGTKVDLDEQRKVSFEEGRLLANIHRIQYIETSAKLNYNVDEAFHLLIGSVPDVFLHNINSSAAKRWRLAATTLCAICRRKVELHRRPRPRHDSSPSDMENRETNDYSFYPNDGIQRYKSYDSLHEPAAEKSRKKSAIFV